MRRLDIALLAVAGLLFVSLAVSAPCWAGFTDIAAGLTGVAHGSVAWGDYDSDGDLDLAIAGDIGSARISKVYRNDNGAFTDTGAPLTSVDSCSLAWGDYDNDGDLDLALTGATSNSARATKIYRNDDGTFADTGAALTDVWGQLAWGDYDNDGDLDLAVAGSASGNPVTKIYRNDNGAFKDSGAALVGVHSCSLAWGDYDKDGDLDLAVAGHTGSTPVSKVYRNDNGAFQDSGAALVGVYSCSLAWGDYDNDGDLDLAIAGNTGSARISKVYRNDNGAFTDIGAPLTGVDACSLAWGDCDNDGDLDLALAGGTNTYGTSRVSVIYRNDNGVFTDSSAAITAVSYSTLAWGDYDNDGKLDLAIAGNATTRIYHNDGGVSNTPPAAPTGLTAAFALNGLVLSWNASMDAQTPASGLTYNIKVGSTAGGSDVFSGMASASNGLRQLPAMGNAQQALTWTLRNIVSRPAYHCSVQAVDTAYAGSAWAEEATATGPKISGRVRLAAGVPGVTISASDATYTTTDADGYYEVVVPSGWSGMLTPAKAGYWFVPPSRSYTNVTIDQTDQDFSAHTLVDIGAPLAAVDGCSLAWGDYDADGDLDLAVSGRTPAMVGISKIYRNDNGVFTDSGAALTAMRYSILAWGDYDNDGDLDLAMAGDTGSTYVSSIYRNNDGVFTDVAAPVVGVKDGSLAWGDYDNDGDLDLALAGQTSASSTICKVYRNDNGLLVDSGIPFMGLVSCSIAWADFDNDGDLDLTVAGRDKLSQGSDLTKLYRNDGSAFTDIGSSLPGFSSCSLAWGDYDNDGDLDFAIAGLSGGTRVSLIYRNEGTGGVNAVPDAPTGLSAAFTTQGLTLSWNAATDAQTSSGGLSYNIRVGSSPGACDVFSGMARASDGLRRIPALGNAQKKLTWSLTNPPARGAYYCSVQAIDTAYAGSGWASESVASGILILISGHVRLSSGGVSGVTVTADNKASYAITDADGYYELVVPSGWSGSVSVNKPGYWFIPGRRSFSVVTSELTDVDFAAATFVDSGIQLAAAGGWLAWGDYDNDGDLDLALAGSTGSANVSKIYRNDDGSFVDIAAALVGVQSASLAWADYDNDGDLDLAMAGNTGSSTGVSRIYRNDNGVFTDIGASLTGVYSCSLAWGDYDNDGDLDLAVGGTASGSVQVTKVYRNDRGQFVDIGAPLLGVSSCSLAWGDYDNDGDLDLAVAGYDGSAYVSRIYRNDGGAFVNSGISLRGVSNCSLAWGDYDNDGDLDLALSGSIEISPYRASRIYRNDNGAFTDVAAPLAAVGPCSLAWGDYDGDGDLDLALAGRDAQSVSTCKLYRNDGGRFVDGLIPLLLPPGLNMKLAWGDYDSDGDIDLAVAGNRLSGSTFLYTTKIYCNESPANLNTRPAAPTDLRATRDCSSLTLAWNAASDAQTPAAGLSYNIRIGSAPGGCDLFSGMADSSSGLRRLPAIGNAQKRLSWTIEMPPALSQCYWSVQAIDTAYAGSAWAAESVVTLGDTTPPSIASVSAVPALVAASDAVRVTVDATDNTWVSSVTANGVGLAKSGTTVWAGNIAAAAGLGTHSVAVIATDAAANTATDSSASYRTGPIYGTILRATTDPIVHGVFGLYLFKLWGKVTVIDSGSFWIDDGSKPKVKVIAPGYSGIADGSFVSARGILDPTADPVTLTCPAGEVVKLQ